jgi:uncharacterized iron-regulated membrane protein
VSAVNISSRESSQAQFACVGLFVGLLHEHRGTSVPQWMRPNSTQKLSRRAFVARRPSRLACLDAYTSATVARQKRRAA